MFVFQFTPPAEVRWDQLADELEVIDGFQRLEQKLTKAEAVFAEVPDVAAVEAVISAHRPSQSHARPLAAFLAKQNPTLAEVVAAVKTLARMANNRGASKR